MLAALSEEGMPRLAIKLEPVIFACTALDQFLLPYLSRERLFSDNSKQFGPLPRVSRHHCVKVFKEAGLYSGECIPDPFPATRSRLDESDIPYSRLRLTFEMIAAYSGNIFTCILLDLVCINVARAKKTMPALSRYLTPDL